MSQFKIQFGQGARHPQLRAPWYKTTTLSMSGAGPRTVNGGLIVLYILERATGLDFEFLGQP